MKRLVEQGIISEEKIVQTLLHQFGLPYLEPTNYDIPQELLEIFDPAMMRRYQFVPIDSIGSVLVVGIAGMLSEELLTEMEHQTGCTVQLYMTKMSEINAVLEKVRSLKGRWIDGKELGQVSTGRFNP